MTRVALAVAVAFALAACGGRASADDQGFHQDVVNGTDGAEVTFDATVVSDPVQSGDHEHIVVKTSTGETLEVDHNTSLAPSVPVHAGDALVIHGQLYIDPGPRVGVHCTHSATSSGCPQSGWIEFGGTYYE